MLEKSFAFLTVLKENNYKEWFHENKAMYEEAKKEFEAFVGQLIKETSAFDKEIGFPEPKDCIFRIFRDIRFSPDKTPYKTNFGAFMARGGNRKSEYAGYYIHFEPGNGMAGGGIWMPQPDILKGAREEIYHNTDEFLSILSKPSFKKHFKGVDEDTEMMLKKAPKDYPNDWPHIGLLKHKSYTVSRSLSDKELNSASLVKTVAEIFEAMMPFNRFFNKVVEDLR